MSRLSKILSLMVVLIFLLACNFVTQPFQNGQDLVQTAQSVTTLIPVETLQAIPSVLPTVIPQETLDALPSVIPSVEAFATEIVDSMDPQGTPLQEWQGIPIMRQATAGEENSGTYSFKANVSAQEVQDYYSTELTALGWTQPSEPVVTAEGGLLFFEKGDNILMILVTTANGSSIVLLTLA